MRTNSTLDVKLKLEYAVDIHLAGGQLVDGPVTGHSSFSPDDYIY
jgi:hypothetical protein